METAPRTTTVQPYTQLPPAMVTTMRALMPQVPALLPPDIEPEQFRAALFLELSGRSALAECTQDSLRDCVVKAAMHGLLPGRDCHFLPFRNREQGGRRTATYVPNYFGLLLALDRTGKVAKAFAHPVYTGDDFSLDYLADTYSHVPAQVLGKPPGALRFFYGCIRMKDGTTHIEVMDEAAIDAVRRRSPAHEQGPWVTDYLLMARKTALKRVAKYVRLTPALQDLVSDDDTRESQDIPPERHAANIVELFGDDPRGSTTTTPAPPETAEEPPPVSTPTPEPSPGGLQNQRPPRGQRRVSQPVPPAPVEECVWRQILRANLTALVDPALWAEAQQALNDPTFAERRGNELANLAADLADPSLL
jgi:recombination protein RecT